MGAELLKNINRTSGARPVNTLMGGPSRMQTKPDDGNNIDAETKRKRQGDHSSNARARTSPYFAYHTSAKGRRDSFDVSTTSSQDDANSIISNNSKANHGAAAGLPEFRKVSKKGKLSSRYRRSRDAKAASQDFARLAGGAAQRNESPDVLSPDEPEPRRRRVPLDGVGQTEKSSRLLQRAFQSNSVLDRSGNISQSSEKDAIESGEDQRRGKSKRAVPTTHEGIEDSEDELQAARHQIRTTNFTHITPSPRRLKRGSSRPETKNQEGQISPSGSGAFQITAVVSATASYHKYQRQADEKCLVFLRGLEPRSKLLKACSNTGQDLKAPWLDVDLTTVTHVFYAAESPSLIIKRRVLGPSRLVIEFETAAVAKIIAMKTPEVAIKTELARFNKTIQNAWHAVEGKSNSILSTVQEDDAITTKNVNHQSRRPPPASIQGSLDKSLPINNDDENERRGGKPRDEPDGKPAARPPQDETRRIVNHLRPSGPGTRRSRRQSPGRDRREKSPDRWTATNQEWLGKWKQSLIYPATGKNRATVDKDDIYRLDEGEFLNDNLINFYLRYLQVTIGHDKPQLLNKVHIFSTFFFEKLRSIKGKINYDGVKSWTSKIDLFTFDYIVVPVNENAHWYLAIVCNAPKAIEEKKNESNDETKQQAISGSPRMMTVEREVSEVVPLQENFTNRRTTRQQSAGVASSPGPVSDGRLVTPEVPVQIREPKATAGTPQKLDPSRPRILTLDSLGASHSPTCRHLREYLIEEAKDKKGLALTNSPTGQTAKGIPEQDNYCDCGVFVLAYMEQFLKNPDEAVRKLLMKEEVGWKVDAPKLRSKIRNLLFDLQAEQDTRLVQERTEKRKILSQKKTQQQARSSQPSSPAAPMVSSPSKQPLPSHVANHNKIVRDSIDESGGSSDRTTSDKFVSARSSPIKDATGSNTEVATTPAKAKDSGTFHTKWEFAFTKPPLPSSSSPANSEDPVKLKRKREISTETPIVVEEFASSSVVDKKPKRAAELDDASVAWPLASHKSRDSSQFSPKPRAKYDGIQRSIPIE